jgi:hypothetical protein
MIPKKKSFQGNLEIGFLLPKKTIPSSVWCFWKKKEEESFGSVEQQKQQQQQQQQCFEFFCLLLENQKQWGAEAAAMF